MASFTYLFLALVAATTIVAGEAVYPIRRLSSSEEEDPEEQRKWSPFKTEFEFRLVALGAAIVALLVGALIVHFVIRCCYGNQNNQQASCQPAPRRILPLMSIEPALVFTYGLTLAGGTDRPECTICLSEFVEGDVIRILSNCRHGFHVKCIETWLQSRLSCSCPTCRSSCLKTSANQNPPEQQQQQQQPPPPPNDVDLEAANPPDIEMAVLQQQQQNDAHEAANLPESEIVILHQQQQQQRTEY